MSCSCVTNNLCEAPANLYPPRTPRTKCYACGLPVCKACSRHRQWAGGRRRVCNNCDQEDNDYMARRGRFGKRRVRP